MFGAKQGPKSNPTSREKCLLVKYPPVFIKDEVGGPSPLNRAQQIGINGFPLDLQQTLSVKRAGVN